jgi:hypothetical protein
MKPKKRIKQQEQYDESRTRRRVSESVTWESPPASAPQQASAALQLQVANLLVPVKMEKWIDAFLDMNLSLEENWSARDEFKPTTLCTNLVNAMRMPPTSGSVDILSKACVLMTNLTHQNRHFADESLNADAPEAIVKAMQQFPLHGDMQLYGCQALRNLAHNEEGAKKVVEDGGADTILGAMRRHSENVYVQEDASGCLWNLASYDPTSITDLIQKGAVEAVLAAMDTHTEDERFQEQTCGFLIEVTANNKEALDRIKKKSGEIVLAKTLNHSRDKNEVIERKAGKLLKKLVSDY